MSFKNIYMIWLNSVKRLHAYMIKLKKYNLGKLFAFYYICKAKCLFFFFSLSSSDSIQIVLNENQLFYKHLMKIEHLLIKHNLDKYLIKSNITLFQLQDSLFKIFREKIVYHVSYYKESKLLLNFTI